MPFSRLTVTCDLTDAQIGTLRSDLTTLIAEQLAKKHPLTSVLIDQVPAGSWSIGAVPRQVAAHLEVIVTAGTNTIAQKQAFLDRTMQLLRRVMPDLDVATYIVVHEVPASDWGYDGRTQADRAAIAQSGT